MALHDEYLLRRDTVEAILAFWISKEGPTESYEVCKCSELGARLGSRVR